jgi:hypothetical protein
VPQIHHFLHPYPDLLLDGSAGWIARKHSGGQIRSFPCQHHFTMVLHALISRGGCTIGPLVATVQRESHPIDMIDLSVFHTAGTCHHVTSCIRPHQ